MVAAPASPLALWKGEYFAQKQGGLFVKVKLSGFKPTKKQKVMTGSVQIEIVNILKKTKSVVTVEPGDGDGLPSQIYKLPSGKYLVSSISVVDMAGIRRTWTSEDEKKKFVVKRLCLSNLGLWTLSPEGKDKLAASFGMIPNSYKESGKKKESSVRAVIDGFTGLVQEKFAGKKLAEAAEDNFGSKRELRATLTFTRQIAMFYKLDLFKHNHHAKGVAAVLAVSDPNLRTCYTDRLEWNDALKGDVKYTFLLSKATGTMSKLKHTGGSANDPKLVECLYYELAQAQFPAPENMIGELTFTFDVR